ncbi:MAG TPA: endolytic transglycosylase MltG [Gemmatimonadales bacterium]|nr:endolytic transglycosylase MltG [Gemmatimonadales bacterium]
MRAVLLALVLAACGEASQGPKVTVTIPRGATFGQAVDSLVSRGVIDHPGWFRLYARARGLPGALKSGVYTFTVDDSWGEVVTALKAGRGAEVRFTVLEGMMAFEIAERARVWLRIPRDSFFAAVKDTSLQRELGIRTNPAGVEGYMYPTTYRVPVGIKARDLVRLMTHEFIERWSPEWDARVTQLGMTRHEVVTLASIIEAEVRYRPDRPYVSAVYHNRLKRRMALQADPTINYAYQRRLRRVWEKNLQIRSPYNTYLHPGLPPGPISQPSDSSIYAALEPAPVGFIYFVAQPDGKHVFSETYADHLAAIRRARQNRR